MAPPLKRRKLFDFALGIIRDEAESTSTTESPAAFSHGVESLKMDTSAAPQHVQEIHLQIQHREVGDAEEQPTLQPRQGTETTSSATTTSSAELASSATSTANEISSVISGETNNGTSSTSAAADSPSSDTFTTGSVPASSTSTSPGGTGIVTSSGSAATSGTAVLISSSSVNATETSEGLSSIATGSQAASTGLASSSSNSTHSAFVTDTSTFTSRPTASTYGNFSTASTANYTDFAFLFLATLSNGDVETMLRSGSEYTTTLADGEVFTIPAVSATLTSTSDETTSSTPSAYRSTAYVTTSLTESGSVYQSTITSIATVDPALAGGQAQAPTMTTHTVSPSTSLASSSNNDDNNNAPPAATIAGGVVGGAAGLAVVLLIAMLFIRWSRRRSQMGHHALPSGSMLSHDPGTSAPSSSGPGMAERAGLRPLAAAMPALFRHQTRSVADSEPSERGFTKVSGRKLPSQFSPGMNGPPPDMPLTGDRNVSTSSFYRDSDAFYGEGEDPLHESDPHRASEIMTVSEGPQRRPTIHHAGGPYAMSPGSNYGSPPGTAATFGNNSAASLDPFRDSRFNEEI